MSNKWLKVVLAMSALAGGSAGAGSSIPVVRPLVARDTRIEVMSTRGLESGSWMLVEPGAGDASWPRELVQIQVADEWHLELLRPLAGSPRASDASVTLLPVVLESEESVVQWLDSPRQQDSVAAGGALFVEGEAPRGTQVLVFVDGVEGAQWKSDESGWFAGTVEMPRHPGIHQVQVVRELEGTWSLHSEPVTVVSLAAPPPPVVNEPVNGSFTNNQRPVFRGTGQATTRVTVAISGVDVGSTDVDSFGNWSLTLGSPLAEGFYTARVRAQFPGEAPSEEAVTNFTVDVTPPDTVITTSPNSRTTERTGQFIFQTGEFASRYECSFENAPFSPCERPYVFNTPLADGKHFFAVRGIDRAGNIDPEPAQFEWIVDTLPPTVEFIARPPLFSNEALSVFTVRASEEVGKYECTLDGEALPEYNCGETTTVGRLAEKSHTFMVRVTDLVGLSQEVSYQWNVDLTPPERPVLLQPVTGALLNSSAPDISGTAEPGSMVKVIIAGSERCTASVDPSGNWTCRPTAPLTTNPSYELALEVRDAASNVNNEFAPIFFAVDVDPPDTFIDVPGTFIRGENGIVTGTASPAFGFRSNEEGVTFECSVGEESFGGCAGLASSSRSFEPGEYSLRVRSRDRAGNVDDSPATLNWVYSPYDGGGGGFSGCSASGATPLLPLVPLLAFLRRRRSRSSPREMAGGSGLLALLMVLLAGPARAQGIDLQQYKPAPGSRDVLGVYSPQVAPGLGLHAGLSVGYARNPLVLRTASDGGFAQSIVSDQVTADVLASISFLDHLELGLALPVTGQWGPAPGNFGVFIPENATGTGLGDLRLVPKAVLPLGETLSLGAAAVLSLPTANSQSFLGAGGVGVQPMLLAQWAASQQLRVLANVGGRFQPAREVPLLRVNVGNELTYALGAHWSGTNSKLFVQGSLEGAVALNNPRSATSPLELLAAVGYSLPGGMAVQLGGGPGLTSGYGTPNFRLFARLDWASSSGPARPSSCTGTPGMDDDKDGVLNAGDLCPYTPGDRGDGCPRDTGAERVNALAQLFKNDSDNDGLLDDEDACPREPGVREHRGCAIPARPAGKESIVVTLSFPSGASETDSPKKLDTVLARLQELLNNNPLAQVHARFPPEQAGNTLMQQRAASVRGYLAQRIPELKSPEKLKVELQGTSARRSGRKELVDVELTLSSPKQLPPPVELKCADQGVAARLMWSYGEVKAGAENKLEALASEGKVCDGELVQTGSAAGAVLVLSAGNVLRLAPDSQVKVSRAGVHLLQGAAEPQGSQAALNAPEILPPCKGSSSPPATLSWQAVPGARRYWVQVARGVDFGSDLRFVLTERPGVSLELPGGGTWYWRVLPVDEKGFAGQPSKLHAFDVGEAVSLRG